MSNSGMFRISLVVQLWESGIPAEEWQMVHASSFAWGRPMKWPSPVTKLMSSWQELQAARKGTIFQLSTFAARPGGRGVGGVFPRCHAVGGAAIGCAIHQNIARAVADDTGLYHAAVMPWGAMVALCAGRVLDDIARRGNSAAGRHEAA